MPRFASKSDSTLRKAFTSGNPSPPTATNPTKQKPKISFFAMTGIFDSPGYLHLPGRDDARPAKGVAERHGLSSPTRTNFFSRKFLCRHSSPFTKNLV